MSKIDYKDWGKVPVLLISSGGITIGKCMQTKTKRLYEKN
jgi:hypothetical protein